MISPEIMLSDKQFIKSRHRNIHAVRHPELISALLIIYEDYLYKKKMAAYKGRPKVNWAKNIDDYKIDVSLREFLPPARRVNLSPEFDVSKIEIVNPKKFLKEIEIPISLPQSASETPQSLQSSPTSKRKTALKKKTWENQASNGSRSGAISVVFSEDLVALQEAMTEKNLSNGIDASLNNITQSSNSIKEIIPITNSLNLSQNNNNHVQKQKKPQQSLSKLSIKLLLNKKVVDPIPCLFHGKNKKAIESNNSIFEHSNIESSTGIFSSMVEKKASKSFLIRKNSKDEPRVSSKELPPLRHSGSLDKKRGKQNKLKQNLDISINLNLNTSKISNKNLTFQISNNFDKDYELNKSEINIAQGKNPRIATYLKQLVQEDSPIKIKDFIEELKSINLFFMQLAQATIRELLKQSEILIFNNEMIYSKGDITKLTFIVIYGKILLQVKGIGNFMQCNDGDTLCEENILLENLVARMENAKAINEVAVIGFDKEKIKKLKEELSENGNKADYQILITTLRNNFFQKKSLRSININS